MTSGQKSKTRYSRARDRQKIFNKDNLHGTLLNFFLVILIILGIRIWFHYLTLSAAQLGGPDLLTTETELALTLVNNFYASALAISLVLMFYLTIILTLFSWVRLTLLSKTDFNVFKAVKLLILNAIVVYGYFILAFIFLRIFNKAAFIISLFIMLVIFWHYYWLASAHIIKKNEIKSAFKTHHWKHFSKSYVIHIGIGIAILIPIVLSMALPAILTAGVVALIVSFYLSASQLHLYRTWEKR